MTSRLARVPRATWVIMVLAVAGLALGWHSKAACLQTYQTNPELGASSPVQIDWNKGRQYELTCYSDTVPLYFSEGLDEGHVPYKDKNPPGTATEYMEYPVVTGFLQYGAAKITDLVLTVKGSPAYPDPPAVVIYFTVMALLLVVAWLVAVALTLPLSARPRDVALMALSPLVAVQAFTNFDTLAVAFAASGLYAWARRRPVLAGVLMGLGGAAKLYPLFILGPLLVLCWRTRTLADWRRAAGGAVAAWLVVNVPVAILWPHGWWEFFSLNSTRPADHDSIYRAISVFTGWAGFDGPLADGQTPTILNLVSIALFAVLCIGIGVIAAWAPRRPRVASLVFLVVAAFLLTNKVWSPQYSLWLVPLAVLALPRWIPLIAWMGVDAYLWVPRLGYFLNLSDPTRGNSDQQFLSVVLVRDALVLFICLWIVWTIYRPSSDPVRATGLDDPAGGVLDDAPDRRDVAAHPVRAVPQHSHGWRHEPAEPAPEPGSRHTP